VLLEKPPGHDPATARSLLAMAAAGKADVRVALNRRFYESTTELSSELEESGETRFIQVLDQESPLEARACGHGELVLRNWMYANAIHMVDFLPIFGRGEITDVHVASRWIPDRPCCVVAHVGFSSGDHGSYHGVWEGPGPWAVAVNTVGARYEMRPVEQLTRQVAGSRRAEPVELPGGENGLKPGLLAQARAAVSLARGAETALPTLTTAIRTMELIERIYFPDRR
jgi:predicted dehydrogenase